MNEQKAREHFSAYFLGELDAGLRQAFERTLETDAQMAAEYSVFERMMRELDGLKHRPIPMVDGLDDKISARLDRHLWEKRQTRRPALAGWWRNVVLGGVATAALVGAFLSLNKSGEFATASFAPGMDRDQLSVEFTDGKALLTFTPTRDVTIVVQSGLDGPEIHRVPLTNQALRSPLENASSSPALLTVTVLNHGEKLVVALPGRESTERVVVGEGTFAQCAMAMADFYRAPVVLTVENPDARLRWDFAIDGPGQSTLAGTDVRPTATEMRSGVIHLKDR